MEITVQRYIVKSTAHGAWKYTVKSAIHGAWKWYGRYSQGILLMTKYPDLCDGTRPDSRVTVLTKHFIS